MTVGASVRQGQSPSLEERLKFLQRVLLRDGSGAPAALVETHWSWLVFGDHRVLKMKKPVVHPRVDLSTAQARRHNACEEVRLNRRLAPGVYRGVLAVMQEDGVLALVPDDADRPIGTAVDWLVDMERLPATLMLDGLVKRQQLRPSQVDILATRLAHFHDDAPHVRLDGRAYVRRLLEEQDDNRSMLGDSRVDLGASRATVDRFVEVLIRHGRMLERRADDGHLVEGHGDLRPEHVCMRTPPAVIDCLEFDASLRELDPFDEIAFLILELDLLGSPWIGRRLWRLHRAILADPVPEQLGRLYTARRALLRARLTAARLLDESDPDPVGCRLRARRYLEIAENSMALLATPALDDQDEL